MGGISIGAGVALSRATAELTVSGTDISGRNVSLSSEAAADAEALVLTAYAAVVYGHSIPHATVDIRDGSSITTTQDLNVYTNADSDLSIVASQNLLGTSTTSEKYNITLAGAYSDLVSKANLSSDSSLIVGDALSIDVNALREHNTQSNAAAYGDGTLGVALNVAVHEATLESLIDGTVVTGGDMTVDAELTTVKNDFNATSTVGTGQLGGRLQAGKAGGMLRGFTSAFTSIFSGAGSAVGGNANFAREFLLARSARRCLEPTRNRSRRGVDRRLLRKPRRRLHRCWSDRERHGRHDGAIGIQHPLRSAVRLRCSL